MPNWRRAYVPGGVYFFTVVTDGRRPIFTDPAARTRLGNVIRACRTRWPFEMPAVVLLPDHLHAIWSLPPGDDAYSRRWGWIKKEFTKSYPAAGGKERHQSGGRQRDGRRGVWQPKFWEHTILDEDDFDRHMDYVHFNPVKHGLAPSPADWDASSFHRWVRVGVYPAGWGRGQPPPGVNGLDATVGE